MGAAPTPWHHPGLFKGQNHPEMEGVSSQSLQMYQPGRWDLVVSPHVLYGHCVGCSLDGGSWNRGHMRVEASCIPHHKLGVFLEEETPFRTQAKAPCQTALVQLPGLVSVTEMESNSLAEKGHLLLHITGSYQWASGPAGSMAQRCPQGPRSFPSPCSANLGIGFVLSLVTMWWQWPQASHSGDRIQRKKRDPLFHSTLLEVRRLFPESPCPSLSYISLTGSGSHAHS